jgi:hypothetical protein
MTTNRRSNRVGVAIALFVGMMISANIVAAQDQKLSGTMIPLKPSVAAPADSDLGGALKGQSR